MTGASASVYLPVVSYGPVYTYKQGVWHFITSRLLLLNLSLKHDSIKITILFQHFHSYHINCTTWGSFPPSHGFCRNLCHLQPLTHSPEECPHNLKKSTSQIVKKNPCLQRAIFTKEVDCYNRTLVECHHTTLHLTITQL